MLILWFLFVYPLAKIPCTATTQHLLWDILWSELRLWLGKMPEQIRNMYEYSADHLRMREAPENWFARAKTATKENPEALS
jgi:hypothetical protein